MGRLTRGWMAAACLAAGVCAGVAGGRVAAQIPARSYLNTGLFPVSSRQEATFSVSLDDEVGRAPATVRLQFLDRTGAVRRSRDVLIGAGQSASLVAAGPGPLRAHAEIVDGAYSLTGRRVLIGGIEINDTLTGDGEPTCIPSVIPKNPGPE